MVGCPGIGNEDPNEEYLVSEPDDEDPVSEPDGRCPETDEGYPARTG